MTDSYIYDNKVFFSNHTQCGTVEWDRTWKEWKFVPKEGCRFSSGWLRDIAKSVDRL